MATKNNPGPFNCYKSAHADEPIFVLKSTDQCAPTVVRIWAILYRTAKTLAGKYDDRARAKVAEAEKCAQAMEDWRFPKLVADGITHMARHVDTDTLPGEGFTDGTD